VCLMRGSGGERGGGSALAARELAGVREGGSVVRFVLCFLLVCAAAVPVPSGRCSVALPCPDPPVSAAPVRSPPRPGGGRGGRAA